MNIQISNIKADLEKKRVMRFARGNVFLQRGHFRTQDEWSELRKTHPERLARLKKSLAESV